MDPASRAASAALRVNTAALRQPPLRGTSHSTAEADFWAELRAEAEAALIEAPLYAGIVQATILDQRSLAQAFAGRRRMTLALHVQSRISEVSGCNIHPAARIGSGVLIDHATGVVIGETMVIADDVSILQSGTLGGNGKESGDRHPTIERGMLLSVGAKVLDDGPAHTTVAGMPARVVSRISGSEEPALTMDQFFGEGT